MGQFKILSIAQFDDTQKLLFRGNPDEAIAMSFCVEMFKSTTFYTRDIVRPNLIG